MFEEMKGAGWQLCQSRAPRKHLVARARAKGPLGSATFDASGVVFRVGSDADGLAMENM